jgi:L-aspartate oxidase
MYRSDIIVVGSGVAGLSFAIKIAEQRPDLKINILTKAGLEDSNSNYAQGGIASVVDHIKDSFDSHIEDTLKSGGGFSDPVIVNLVVRSGPDRILELAKYGVKFTHDASHKLDLVLEGGHSKPRVVHSHDNTGEVVIKTLIKTANSYSNISFFDHQFCMELLKTEDAKIGGVATLNTINNKIEFFESKIIVLATGGIGQIYKHTTNPSIATGDAISLGLKVEAMVSNLNYIQFHPTALIEKNKSQLFLISEAIRGFGAYIVNRKGQRFLFNSDKMGELATRDVVSKAIFHELKTSWADNVYLDCRHLDKGLFKEKFPTIHAHLFSIGINIKKDLIPVAPAAHYQCGGLKVNERGQTNIEGLYAIGECAETGLHGVNRLASNSLLEALVFAHEAAEFISCTIDDFYFEKVIVPQYQEVSLKNDYISLNLTEMLKETMSNFVTVASDEKDIKSAMTVICEIEDLFRIHKCDVGISYNWLTAENTLLVAKAIIYAKLNEFKDKKNCTKIG